MTTCLRRPYEHGVNYKLSARAVRIFDIDQLYDEFATHFGCALLAARPAHSRDKPKVENVVLFVER
jgi:hypothetical protein